MGCTGVVNRTGLLLVVSASLALALAGCGSSKPPTTGPTTPTSSAPTTGAASSAPATGSPGATATADAVEFSVDGAGPYQLGMALTSLAPTDLDGVKPSTDGCVGKQVADAAGTWSGAIQLAFDQSGLLYLLVNKSINIPTPSGAWIGTSLTDLKKIYTNIQGELLKHGTSSAYLVTTLSSRGILFDLDPNSHVIAMTAGDSTFLKSSYTGGTPYLALAS